MDSFICKQSFLRTALEHRRMLTHLSISNYAIADRIDLEFDRGMSVITGETGAGKSITLDALGLALGDRADSKSVRKSADKAEIYAGFDLTGNPHARAWLQQRDLLQGDELLLRRVIFADGKSRAYINGAPATLQDMKTLGSSLIDIHGQHDHQSLLKRDTQRKLLDEYAGTGELCEAVGNLVRSSRQLHQQIDALKHQDQEQTARIQLLRYQVEELEQIELCEGYVEQLEAEQKALANAEGILAASHQALNLCSDDENSASETVSHACRLLQQMPQRSPALEDALQLLENAHIQLQEAEQSLRHHAENFEIDPLRLQEVEQQLSAIYQIARKHRIHATELVGLAAQLRAELETLDGGDEKIDQLEQELATLESELAQRAAALSRKRATAASALGKAVNKLLKDLCMQHCTFEVHLARLDEPGTCGMESPELRVSTNPDQQTQPLGKVASGGELSRIGLAIQVATTHTNHRPTLVFDEVDSGIGGGVAEVVGNLLRQLGEKCQVLCVTHLAQVACQGHHHFVVSKTISSTAPKKATKQARSKAVTTQVLRLQENDKVAEIARMLGGIAITEQTRAHAQEMLTTQH
jgi:DNA repair protein RecN (Recombination protein N)